MKNLFSRLAIIVLLASVNTTQAQLPQMKSEVFTPSPDGKIYLNSTIMSSSMELYNFTSSSYTARTTKVRDILRERAYIQQKGQKWVYTLGILAYPDVDTLQLRMATNNYSGPFGNFVVASSGTSPMTNRVKTFSLNGQNDGQYVPINTTDGTWIDAVYEGVSGFKFKKWVWEIDSIPPSQCDANGLFYYLCEITVESLRHPLGGNAPYIAPYYFNGPVSGPHKITNVWRSAVGIKKVDASFSTASFTRGSDATSITTGVRYFPTNYYDSINCKKLVVELVKNQGNILVGHRVINPFWHRVDQNNTGESRTDKLSEWFTWNNLSDTTSYTLNYYDSLTDGSKTLKYSEEILTKKLYAPAYIQDIVVSEITHNSVKITLTHVLGNVDTAPLEISIIGTGGVVSTKTFVTEGPVGQLKTEVWTVTGLIPGTGYAAHPKKNGGVIKPIVPFTMLPEPIDPIVITTVDPISWATESVTFNGDSSSATYTVTCTPGNDGLKIYILATDDYGVAAELDFDPKVTKTVSVPGYKKGQDRTMKIHTRTNTGSGIVDVLKGTFVIKSASAGGGTVGINTASTSNLLVYPNPVSDVLYIDNLKKGTEIELYTQLGKKVQSTTEKTIDVSHLPAGVYFLHVDGNSLKVIKE